jgi:hypothetical protein
VYHSQEISGQYGPSSVGWSQQWHLWQRFGVKYLPEHQIFSQHRVFCNIDALLVDMIPILTEGGTSISKGSESPSIRHQSVSSSWPGFADIAARNLMMMM